MSGMVDGKVAVVTGGASGIGRAACQIFAREGAKVVVSDVNDAGGAETVELIEQAGGAATYVHCDTSDAGQVEAMVKAAVDTYGSLDCAFNNAGVGDPTARIVDCTEEEFDRFYQINLKGVWLCMKYEIKQMLIQGGGAIVNTASIAGLIAAPNLGAYGASKHGVVGLTKTGAIECATKKIRVNAVCPGVIRTPMVEILFKERPGMEERMIKYQPVHRLGVPEEIGEAAVWLCSDAASFVTGHALPVDGGIMAV
jgi:NAD(P)-dependent dehydrogenase (short-subunit alcohol dehydrogenase family)